MSRRLPRISSVAVFVLNGWAAACLAPAALVVAPAAGGGPKVRVFTGAGGSLRDLFAYDVGFTGGAFVGSVVTTDNLFRDGFE